MKRSKTGSSKSKKESLQPKRKYSRNKFAKGVGIPPDGKEVGGPSLKMKSMNGMNATGSVPTPVRGRPPTDPFKLAAWRIRKEAWESYSKGEAWPKPAKPAKAKRVKAAKDLDTDKKTTPTEGRGWLAGTAVEKKLSLDDLPAIIDLFQSLKITLLEGDNFILKLTPRTENPSGSEKRAKPRRQGAVVDPGPRSLQVAINREDEQELELTQRLIDDPVGYEQAQIDAHLGRNNDFGDQI